MVENSSLSPVFGDILSPAASAPGELVSPACSPRTASSFKRERPCAGTDGDGHAVPGAVRGARASSCSGSARRDGRRAADRPNIGDARQDDVHDQARARARIGWILQLEYIQKGQTSSLLGLERRSAREASRRDPVPRSRRRGGRGAGRDSGVALAGAAASGAGGRERGRGGHRVASIGRQPRRPARRYDHGRRDSRPVARSYTGPNIELLPAGCQPRAGPADRPAQAWSLARPARVPASRRPARRRHRRHGDRRARAGAERPAHELSQTRAAGDLAVTE